MDYSHFEKYEHLLEDLNFLENEHLLEDLIFLGELTLSNRVDSTGGEVNLLGGGVNPTAESRGFCILRENLQEDILI